MALVKMLLGVAAGATLASEPVLRSGAHSRCEAALPCMCARSTLVATPINGGYRAFSVQRQHWHEYCFPSGCAVVHIAPATMRLCRCCRLYHTTHVCSPCAQSMASFQESVCQRV